jgi:hypothetical protein
VTTRYEIYLDGVHARDLPLGILRDLADLVIEGSSRAARLAAEGRSTARGSAPVWLGEASDVRLVGFREGSLVLDVTARPLAAIAPGIFPMATGETAIDLLMLAVDDALQGRRDSERLDLGMLQTLVKARSLFGRGASRLRFMRVGGAAIELAEPAMERFQRLATETPPSKVDLGSFFGQWPGDEDDEQVLAALRELS